MRSTGGRLALWYAGVSSATLLLFFVAGYFLLDRYMVHGLDLLNQSQFEQIRANQVASDGILSPEEVSAHLATGPGAPSALFYVQVSDRSGHIEFASSNLAGRFLPSMPTGKRVTLLVDGPGKLRIGSFALSAGTMVIGTSYAEAETAMDGYTEISLVLLCLMVVVSVITGIALSRAAMRPVRMIQETANHIRSDNLSERIPVSDVQDDVSNLARLLNEMFDRLERAFTQVRRFTEEASHELKTPLSLVRLHGEKLLTDGGLTATQEEAVQSQLEEIGRLNKIIEELLFLSRAEAQVVRLELRREDPRRFLQAFASDAKALSEHRGLTFALSIEGNGKVDFDAKWLRQVLYNLVQNAINVSTPPGRIELRAEFTFESWRVCVEDQGPGVPESQRERIFERFVRLEPLAPSKARGSGLGLSISRSIIELHHGAIRAEAAREGPGLCMVFELPIAEMDRHEAARPPAEPSLA